MEVCLYKEYTPSKVFLDTFSRSHLIACLNEDYTDVFAPRVVIMTHQPAYNCSLFN